MTANAADFQLADIPNENTKAELGNMCGNMAAFSL